MHETVDQLLFRVIVVLALGLVTKGGADTVGRLHIERELLGGYFLVADRTVVIIRQVLCLDLSLTAMNDTRVDQAIGTVLAHHVTEAFYTLHVHTDRCVVPDQVDLVVCHQLLDLGERLFRDVAIHIRLEIHGQVGMDVAELGSPVQVGRVRLVPVLRIGIVDAELQTLRMAGLAQLLDDIPLERCVVDDIVLADQGIEEGKAVVVLGGDNHIAHARILEDLGPFIGVKLRWIELGGHLVVFFRRNLGGDLDPFGIAKVRAAALVFALECGIDAKVNERAELGVAKPLIQTCL